MNYSDRARKNMTRQVLSQLKFFENNLEKKQKRLDRTERWLGHRLYSRLPGLKWTYKIQLKGVNKVKKDLVNHKKYINKLEKEGKINPIIDT